MIKTEENPLLKPFNTRFNTTPFHLIATKHFIPALKTEIQNAKGQIEAIKLDPNPPTFENTIEPLEFCSLKVNTIAAIFFNLNSAETSDDIQEVAREFSPMLSKFSNDIQLDAALFSRVEEVWEKRATYDLDSEQSVLLENTYKSFVRNGARLDRDEKELLRTIDSNLSKLSLQYGENILAETNKFILHLNNRDYIIGLPESVCQAASLEAKQRGMQGWVFTLDYPSYVPFMTHSSRRDLREQMYKAFSSRAFKEDALDNRTNVQQIVHHRHTRAQLLGYETHADFVLEKRMAKSSEAVNEFLNTLLNYAKPAAQIEFEKVQSIALEDEIGELERWDWAYYAEKLKQREYSLDDEMLKPYFELNKVVGGVFETAQRLYGITFHKRPDLPVYHHDVMTYEVMDEKGEHVAVFYADFHPRSGKRAGAWMTSYRSQFVKEELDHRPHVSIVCNFSKPTDKTPALLTFNEVTTLFHEFGHALHGMLAKGKYPSLSGTSVSWDFVELPSQIMENWCFEKECLQLFARHYETNAIIPNELIEKIKKASTFNEGYATLRQLSFGLLDMKWHGTVPGEFVDVDVYEKESMRETDLFPEVEDTNMSVSFSHIFQGGYSAGYYSYKWAEVLDADAFELFKQKGVFDKETAKSFKENILEKGGSADPMELYKSFRGAEPDPKSLLRRSGLIKK